MQRHVQLDVETARTIRATIAQLPEGRTDRFNALQYLDDALDRSIPVGPPVHAPPPENAVTFTLDGTDTSFLQDEQGTLRPLTALPAALSRGLDYTDVPTITTAPTPAPSTETAPDEQPF